MMKNRQLISAPRDLRGVLLQALVGVLEGRVSVPQANAVVGLSGEMHKSIRQEFEMRCYASNLTIEGGAVKPALSHDGE